MRHRHTKRDLPDVGVVVEVAGKLVKLKRGRFGWSAWLLGAGGAVLPLCSRVTRAETLADAAERISKMSTDVDLYLTETRCRICGRMKWQAGDGCSAPHGTRSPT